METTNKFILNIVDKLLIMFYFGERFEFELDDSIGEQTPIDYWNSFKDNNGVIKDINLATFDGIPILSVYDLVEQDGGNVIDTSKFITITDYELIGEINNENEFYYDCY